MDWSKAKNILIIAFIITNVLLIYVLVGDMKIDEPTIKDEFIEEVIVLLENKDINIATQIPKETPYLNTITVAYEKTDIDKLNRTFFKNTGSIKDSKNYVGEINKNLESLILTNKKLILYENKKMEDNYKDLDKDKAIKIAEEFLIDKQFSISDTELTYVKEEKGTYYLEYSKVYGDIFIEKAFTTFQIDERGVKSFERLWLNEKDIGETEIYISTAPKSILGLLDREEIYGKTIKDISLCYYFDPEKHEYLEKPGEAKQGKAVPAWRVEFDDGYKVFLDEY